MSAEIARCDREIAEILARPDVINGTASAYLVVMGIEDWELEKRMLSGDFPIVSLLQKRDD